MLVVRQSCLTQVDPARNKKLTDYHYKDIDAVIKVCVHVLYVYTVSTVYVEVKMCVCMCVEVCVP